MRIYFLSSRTAGLRLDGVYAGIIDNFERFFETDEGANVLAEVIPDGNAEPLNFFINEKFFLSPPPFADVYKTDGDYIISLSRYQSKDGALRVIAQTRFSGGLVTLVNNGGSTQLICEYSSVETYALPQQFSCATFKEENLGGFPVLIVEGEKCLTVISQSGKQVFLNPAESWEVGEKLKIRVAFPTCAQCFADCVFSYDGNKMVLEESRTQENCEPAADVAHFAFFESVLTRADPTKYLCEELKPRAGELASFLGEFVEVNVPTQKFYAAHPEICAPESYAAGLTYPLARNLFQIKYFAVQMQDGLISNIYEVEN